MRISNNQYKIEITKNSFGSLVSLTFKGHHDTNQDSYSYFLGHEVYLAVADGLGSAIESDKGSSLATHIAIKELSKHDFTVKSIFPLWKQSLIGEKLVDFDSTLKLVKITSGELRISSVGDGGILYQLEDSGFKVIQDNLDYVNETNSLLQSNNRETVIDLHVDFVSKVDVMVFTDGLELIIAEDKISEFATEMKNILNNYTEDEIGSYLQEWLDTWLDKNVYDDVTMIYYTRGGLA